MQKEHFEVVLADDEHSRRIHYRLRYQVFCLETGYEDPARFPDGEEKDEWDQSAAHFLVRERDTQNWVAAMRLVSPQNATLPIAARTSIAVEQRAHSSEALEISRLCMVGHYRRRLQGQAMPMQRDDNITNLHDAGRMSTRAETHRRLRTAEILRSLLDAGVAYSRERGTRHWYIFTTRALAKVLGYVLPLHLRQVGESVWHRGERFPFLVNIEHLLDSSQDRNASSQWRPAFHRYSELFAASNMPRAVGAD